MFEAKVTKNEKVNDKLVISVEFSDGVKAFTEEIEPATKSQFYNWVEGRLHSLNSVTELEGEVVVDQKIEAPAAPISTQEEKDLNIWLRKMARLQTVKTSLIDTGVFSGTEAPIEALRADIKATFKPEYIGKL